MNHEFFRLTTQRALRQLPGAMGLNSVSGRRHGILVGVGNKYVWERQREQRRGENKGRDDKGVEGERWASQKYSLGPIAWTLYSEAIKGFLCSNGLACTYIHLEPARAASRSNRQEC
jgi:hypothetical protein